MKDLKKHILVWVFCLVVALLIIEYYHITNSGALVFDRRRILGFLLVSVLLFGTLECCRWFALTVIIPKIEQKKHAAVCLILFAVSLVISVAALVAYLLLSKGKDSFQLIHVVYVLIGAVALTLLFYAEAWIARQVSGGRKTGKGVATRVREIMAIVVCFLFTGFSFIPVLSDFIQKSYPYARTRLESMDVGWEPEGYSIVGEITTGTEVSQSFVCKTDVIQAITLSGATYARENDSILQILLIEEESGKPIEGWDLEAKDLKDNSPFTIRPEDPFRHSGMKGKRYQLVLLSEDAVSGNAVTVYYNIHDRYPNGSLTINGEDTGGDLIMQVVGITEPKKYENVRIWLCIYNAVIIHVIVWMAYRKAKAIVVDN